MQTTGTIMSINAWLVFTNIAAREKTGRARPARCAIPKNAADIRRHRNASGTINERLLTNRGDETRQARVTAGQRLCAGARAGSQERKTGAMAVERPVDRPNPAAISSDYGDNDGTKAFMD
jgi:hypothetical protein